MTSGIDTPHIALSVMIPTWNPNPRFLETAVTGVLAQLHGELPVQIELVDDYSPDFDVAAFARRFPTGRVSWHRNNERRGLAGNWNECIARSKHDWVHILHQDDCVLDGFYPAILRGLASPTNPAAAFTASYFIDESGRGWAPQLVAQKQPGILENWLQHIFVSLSIQCSAMVVRRDVYDCFGGFDHELAYTLDWDLWKRMAVRYPIWFEPRPLACFRRHPASETSRQRKSGEHVQAIFKSIENSAVLLPSAVAEQTARRARQHYAGFAAEEALGALLTPGGLRTAMKLLGVTRNQTSMRVLSAAMASTLARACFRPITSRWGSRRINLPSA